jgi:hypothetical protein
VNSHLTALKMFELAKLQKCLSNYFAAISGYAVV